MNIEREGMSRHVFTDAGQYVGTVAVKPDEKPDSDEIIARLGVRSTPFEYDFDDDAGAVGTLTISRNIPEGARVIGGEYKVETTFTSATDAGTIALGADVAGDLVTAAAISVGTAFDAASPVGLLLGTKDTVTVTTAEGIKLTFAVEAITAGKLRGYVLWTFDDAVTAA